MAGHYPEPASRTSMHRPGRTSPGRSPPDRWRPLELDLDQDLPAGPSLSTFQVKYPDWMGHSASVGSQPLGRLHAAEPWPSRELRLEQIGDVVVPAGSAPKRARRRRAVEALLGRPEQPVLAACTVGAVRNVDIVDLGRAACDTRVACGAETRTCPAPHHKRHLQGMDDSLR